MTASASTAASSNNNNKTPPTNASTATDCSNVATEELSSEKSKQAVATTLGTKRPSKLLPLPKRNSNSTINTTINATAEEEADAFAVYKELHLMIRPLMGNPFQVVLAEDATFGDLQEAVYGKVRLQWSEQQLSMIVGGEEKEVKAAEDMPLTALGIRDGALIKLAVRMTSGLDTSLFSDDADFSEAFLMPSTSINITRTNSTEELAERMLKTQISCEKENNAEAAVSKGPSFCGQCKKRCRPGLQFTCKCGGMYCNVHRYHDAHGCTFDIKKHDKSILAIKLQSKTE